MTQSKSRILVVDDEPNIILSIESCLNPLKYEVDGFNNVRDAFIALQRHVYDCALIDIRLKHESGLDLFKQMIGSDILIPVVFMSGNASLNEAVESQKLGAYDFIEKPFSSEKIELTIQNGIDFFRLKNRLTHIENTKTKHQLIGEHSLMQELRSEILKVSMTDAAVLIQGESGTGKDIVASSIHENSKRAANELISINCSAIPAELIESALFGHTKGAFTGANNVKKGYFEQAHKGTVFLDEIGDMPLAAQARLLRVLESREIQKVGADTATKVDVRVIAATHKDLKLEVEKGNFRQDLFYRISVIPINTPALNEHLNDLPLLAEHLITGLCKRNGLAVKKMDPQCYKLFEAYSWPGNVRELANTLERMLIMGGELLQPIDIPVEIRKSGEIESSTISAEDTSEMSLKECRASAERTLIVNRLDAYSGNVSQVARSLGIDRTNLHKKIKLYSIEMNRNYH
jgi:DNA-binding NtrC family response regulator